MRISIIKYSSELLHKQRGDGLLVVSNLTPTFMIMREEAGELDNNIHHNTKLQSKQSGQSAAALIIMQTFSIFSPIDHSAPVQWEKWTEENI